MRKSLAGFLAGIFLAAPPAAALESRTTVDERLRINRLLLAQYAREFGRLRRAQRDVTTRKGQERLYGLRAKIRVLKEDAERLESRKPIHVQADAFLNQFIKRRGTPAPRAAGAPKSEFDRTKLHEEALKFVAEKNLPEAARRYEEIALNAPDDDEAYLLLGHVYVMMGHYDRAEFAYYNSVHIDRENYGEIIPFYQNLIVQHPDDDEAYRFLGYAYVILGDGVKAKDAYEEALRINPANLEARKGLAILSQRFGI